MTSIETFIQFLSGGMRIGATVQWVLLLVWLLRSQVFHLKVRVLCVFAMAVCGYLVSPLAFKYGAPASFSYFVLILAYTSAPMIWLLSRALFDDQFRVRASDILIFAIVQVVCFSTIYVLPTSRYVYEPIADNPELTNVIRCAFPQILNFLFAGLALYQVQRGAIFDLIEARLKFRTQFILVTSLMCAGITVLEILAKVEPSLRPWLDVVCTTPVYLLGYFLSLHFRSPGPTLLESRKLQLAQPEVEPANLSVDDEAKRVFLTVVEEKKCYLQNDMSVQGLAELLNAPEYRVRRYINQELGFQNFNQFLNHYRVQEAIRILKTTEGKAIPIYNLALELGYGSALTFNRAFKEATGKTPTQFKSEPETVP